jgi:ADP-ribosylglycohydrolase
MIGAIAGDIIGSVYEHRPIKTKDFPLFAPGSRFTDDSVLTVAVADAILSGRGYAEALHDFGHRYPRAGYGGAFMEWLHSREPRPYGSWGNGAAMRVSPVGWAFDSEDPEGIKGAQATALTVFLARMGYDREEVRDRITALFGYELDATVAEIRPDYTFDVSCQGTVPPAIVCFLESESWEDAVRNAVSLGGDSDTLACIAGAMAEACYGGVPAAVRDRTMHILPHDLGSVVEDFRQVFMADR